MADEKQLGLIAGNGKFPLLFAREARSRGYRVVAVGVRKDTLRTLKFFVDQFSWVGPGELKKVFGYFQKAGVRDVIMAGQVNPQNLFDAKLSLDEEFKELFLALENRKADTIFSAVADRLKREGLTLLDSTFLMQDYLASPGTLTQRGPGEQELLDISFGMEIARAMGAVDVGQTVVVKERAIVAIEAMEGTDQTILRGGRIARQGAVIVKMSKPAQDLRFDVPVIGTRTIRHMIKCRARCLAIEAGKTVIIDREDVLRLANKHRICVVAVALPSPGPQAKEGSGI